MTIPNDTEIKVYRQLKKVSRCIDAMKDVAQCIPEDEKHYALLGILIEKLEQEFLFLHPMVFKN